MAPKVPAAGKGEKRAGKVKSAPTDPGKKKKRSKRKESYAIYSYKVQPCLFHMGAPQLSPKNGGHKISSPSRESFNPLHPSIDRNILHSVLNTFHMVLTGTIF